MADQDDFMFDEEEESGADANEASEDWGEYEPEKKGGSKRTLYLLLLLLVLAGAGAYFFLLGSDDGPSPPVKVVAAPKKPIAAPMPAPAPAQPAAPAAAPTPTPSAAPATAQGMPAAPTPAATPAAPAPAPMAETAKPVPAAPAAPPAPAPAPAPAPMAAKAAPAAPVAAPVAAEPKLFEPQAAPSAADKAGAYTLSAGAYLMQSSVDDVVKKIHKLGYEPVVSKIKRKVEMTRLLVGVYPAATAAKKLAEVKRVTNDAFTMSRGAQTAVYAGSYLVLDHARVFADTMLMKNGIHVTEEPVKVDRTLQRVTFGSFATTDAAAKVAREAAGRGLEAKPVKK